jgi:hypothetical protein
LAVAEPAFCTQVTQYMSEGVSCGDQYAGIDLSDLDIAAVGLTLSLEK